MTTAPTTPAVAVPAVAFLPELVAWQARQDPLAEAVRDSAGTTLTRAELVSRSHQLAVAMRSLGLEPGDRVAVLAKNHAEYAAIYLATMLAGVVLVPLNARLAPAEWSSILRDASTRLLIGVGPLVGQIATVQDSLPPGIRLVAASAVPPSGWIDYSEWVAAADDPPREVVAAEPGCGAIIMYTSGTTGTPKGVVIDYAAISANMTQLTLLSPALVGGRILVVAPFYHVGALMSLFALSTGGSLYIQEDFVPAEVLRVLDEEAITTTALVPAMIQMLLDVPGATRRSYANLRSISYGAAPITKESLRRAIETFGCEFAQAFGQTESPVITMLTHLDHQRALSGERPELLGSVGRAAPGVDIRIVAADGRECAPGETGEILAKTPVQMKEYWQREEESADVLCDGWLKTGDAGYLDDQGYLFLRDRIKDLIVSGGENVYPAEVETVLKQHPAVLDAAVIGIPHERWGEAVHAVVECDDSHRVDPSELITLCRSALAAYKCPRSIDVVDALPRNASMKVLKRELREPFWRNRTRPQ
ncbi:class I adenylate-forming enzyme family protein [Mycobacterium sp. NAZ190054]|uniref:class I adenylate-forming enzyme family protein n=1 Tax=Mycobacterium sp. NAZ190054 TaxID=1747766 RepID=UPI000799B34F|nr:AMP-binding protein [Mycobacterium sp. NAZ190054]KWX57763.1 hypothetical protein ASJ79_10475 [Mycobacterium sp. NAZ190054]